MKSVSYLRLLALAAGMSLLMNCAAVQEGISTVSGGKISKSDAEAAVKVGKAFRDSFEDINESEEYYIGRAVAALVLSKYPVYQNETLTAYINKIGNSVAVYSDRPEIYAGYHFLILDTDEVNALSAPGGFIFITKGLLKRCRNEEMIGNILAHEVAHVAAKHGLKSIKKSRLIDAFKIMGTEAAKKYGPQELSELTAVFEGVLSDIVENLIERGYDRKYEYEADQQGVKSAAGTGYDPKGMADFLKTMVDDSAGQSGKGWFKTHPSAQDRLGKVSTQISSIKPLPGEQKVRTSRFVQTVKGLK